MEPDETVATVKDIAAAERRIGEQINEMERRIGEKIEETMRTMQTELLRDMAAYSGSITLRLGGVQP